MSALEARSHSLILSKCFCLFFLYFFRLLILSVVQTITVDDLIAIGIEKNIHRLKLVTAAQSLKAPSKTALKLMGATSDESSSDPTTEASPAPVATRGLMPMMGMEYCDSV